MSVDIADQIERMYDLGFSITPPFVKGDNKGLTVEPWKQYQTKRCSLDKLMRWYRGTHRHHNYGIITGKLSNIVALDADDEEARKLVEYHCDPTPIKQITGRGKWHFVYKCPADDEVRNIQKIKCQGVTYNLDLRGEGGIIVGPGSIHYKTGKPYTEFITWTKDLLEKVPVFNPSWLNLDTTPTRKKTDFQIARPEIHFTEKQSLARQWLKTRPGSESGKGASNYCFAVACSLVHGFDLSPDEALPIFAEWGDRGIDEGGNYYPWNAWELRHKLEDATLTEDPEGRPQGYLLNEREVINILEQQVIDGNIIAGEKTDWTFKDKRNGLIALGYHLGEEPQVIQSKTRRVPSILHYIGRGKDAYDWAIPGKLRQGVLAILSGDAKAGKTTLAYNTALDMILNKKCWGTTCEPLPIIHLDYETDPTFIKQNMIAPRMLTDEELKELDKFLYATDTLDPDENLRLPECLSTKYLDEIIEQYQHKGIIIVDTFRASFSALAGLEAGWDFKADVVRKILAPFLQWCHRTGWTLLILTHNNKAGQTYGSVDFKGVADQLLTLTRELDNNFKPTNNVKLSIEGRLPACAPLFFNFNNGVYEYIGTEEELKANDKSVKRVDIAKQIIEIIEENGAVTQSRAREVIKGNNSIITDVFQDLVQCSVLTSLGHHKGYRLCDNWKVGFTQFKG